MEFYTESYTQKYFGYDFLQLKNYPLLKLFPTLFYSKADFSKNKNGK
jgi:hypothetical protein